jgi:predicted TPR repeat methyltransferase
MRVLSTVLGSGGRPISIQANKSTGVDVTENFAGSTDLAEELRTAVGLHQKGELDEAEGLYRSALYRQPDHPDALHFLGVLLHQRGRSQEALASMRGTITVCPSHADAHNNMGNILKDLGKLDEAEACFRQAIILVPDHVNAHHNLAMAFEERGKFDEAVSAYRTVVHLWPSQDNVRYHLGMLLYSLGQIEQAIASFQEWLQHDPDNSLAQHMLAAWTGENQPSRATDDYVRQTFDQFSHAFDEKLGHLEYQAPSLTAGVIQRLLREPDSTLDVLDAGCGTGLCGPLLRPYAGRLSGVDISSGMIDKARERGVYDELVTGELTWLLEKSALSYDLIVAADTLCYFGDLDQVLQAMELALRSGGSVVFTLEHEKSDQSEGGFQLNQHGRYSHTEEYTRAVLKQIGLKVKSLSTAVLRMEQNKPVDGLVVLASKSGN